MNPVALEMLLWFASGVPDVYPKLLEGGNDVAFALGVFLKEQIVVRGEGPNTFAITPRGTAWLNLMLATPMPVQQWVDPRQTYQHRQVPADAVVSDADKAYYAASIQQRVFAPIVAATPAQPAAAATQAPERPPATPAPEPHVPGREGGNLGKVVSLAAKGGPTEPVPLPADQGYTPWSGSTSPVKPKDLEGNAYVQVFRRNGQVQQMWVASINWKDRGKPDDVIGYMLAPEPPAKAHVGNSPKSRGSK